MAFLDKAMKGTGAAFRLPLVLSVLLLLPWQTGSVARENQSATPDDGTFFQSKQFQRWYWLYQRRASRGQRILPGTLRRAARQLQRARELQRASQSQMPGQAEAVDDAERWVSIGPTPIDVAGRTYYAGRTAAVAVDPGDASHWLIGAAQGGIWETADAGKTWESRTDGLESLASGAIAFSSSHPGVVYAGTGESTFPAAPTEAWVCSSPWTAEAPGRLSIGTVSLAAASARSGFTRTTQTHCLSLQ